MKRSLLTISIILFLTASCYSQEENKNLIQVKAVQLEKPKTVLSPNSKEKIGSKVNPVNPRQEYPKYISVGTNNRSKINSPVKSVNDYSIEELEELKLSLEHKIEFMESSILLSEDEESELREKKDSLKKVNQLLIEKK